MAEIKKLKEDFFFKKTLEKIIKYSEKKDGLKGIKRLKDRISKIDIDLEPELLKIYKFYKNCDHLYKEGIRVFISNILSNNIQSTSDKIYPINIKADYGIVRSIHEGAFKNLINQLNLVEVNIKVKAEKVRRMHMEFGESFYRAQNLIKQIEEYIEDKSLEYNPFLESKFYDKVLKIKNDYHNFDNRIKKYEKLDLFKLWYEDLGFNRSFVRDAINRYEIYLYFSKDKTTQEKDEFYLFMTKLSVRTIRVLSKKEVSWNKRKELLLLIYENPNIKSTEIQQMISSDAEIFKKFKFSKAMSLMNKIDRVKNKLSESDYKEMMKNFSEIEKIINQSLKKEKEQRPGYSSETF
ncbi:hypothetical protein PM10SUCC1_32960 [Propionigenium maris DSM 9537]|uniref:Uncharacterized protein n=1 Tax=Propionigenium maris DSM 9537 TaxID=1123000 RepID=A0A9W6LPN5_9FUSO|nr:hypothetical protein [Propionigenium maris]GLI57782.1 hypothetical protein PM10SUCC1_32960 [Propionigenium maris DSM 9537]